MILLLIPTGEIPDNLFGWLLMAAVIVALLVAIHTLTRKGEQ